MWRLPSWVPLPPSPTHLGSENIAGGAGSRKGFREGAAGTGGRQEAEDRGERGMASGLLGGTGAVLPAPWAGDGPGAPRGSALP